MSNEKSKPAQNPNAAKPAAKQETKAPQSASKTPAPIRVTGQPAVVPKLFRRWDWITFWLTTLVVFIGYFYTLAPDVTLEDSGELAVASFYAGVPHPPGYPVWTIYTWIFTWLFPFSNIAWRVGLSSAVAGAFACGLVGLLVSRGSSMLMEGIGTLKDVEAKYEHWINLVAGFVAGMLLGYNGFMWSQAVIVEVYTLSVLSLVSVLCFLLRWMYAPQQRKYLYWAAFMFGICLNNHQTLVVAAMGIEILVLAVQPRLGRNLLIVNTVVYFLVLILRAKGQVVFMNDNPVLFGIFNAVGICSALGALYLAAKTKNMLADWVPVIIMGILFGVGMAFYFYMPVAGMTNPPLNWGYPRTETGFWHAFTRGQYDKTNPVNPFSGRFIEQVLMVIFGAGEEFNYINLMIGLLPFFFYKRMLKRDRAWIVGLGALYVFLAFLLLILLNPNTDMQSKEQSRVFFAASHVIIAIAIGYGIAIIGTLIATEYQKMRLYLLGSAAVASGIAIFNVVALESDLAMDRYNAIFLLVLALVATAAFMVSRVRMPLGLILGVFALLPLNSVFAHWSDNEQRGHYFGYWFGHDMFTPPYDIYPEMEKNAILFGGTDPGRFNPTYMIFCESFIPPSKKPRDPKFDRRDVYLITQNALADGTYLDYIRAHYNRSAQKDPYFFVNFFRTTNEEELGRTNLFARMMVPIDRFFTRVGAKIEKRRRIEGVYPPKENPTTPSPEAREINIGGDLYDVGTYLSKEIITPSPEDSQQAFAEYIQDAQRRLQHDMAHPNEPKQIKMGEDVRVVDNRISVSGQVAVMAINALLTKIIFDKNPTNEFYVEESFPLDWMFPHLTPYGIIMKINRNPVPELTDEMIKKDHEFWSRFSERLVGNWITYDTPVKEICDFAERVYRRRDYAGFKGSKEFVRDDNAQKAFSKLRSAIGGVYYWRLQTAKSAAENARYVKEAEFAFKQSFAYCPFSPEAVFKYVQLLVNVGRAAEADLVVKTCLRWDPENMGIQALAENISQIIQSQQGQRPMQQSSVAPPAAPSPELALREAKYQQDPTNLTNAFSLASAYFSAGKSNDGFRILEMLIDQTNANAQSVLSVAKAYSDLGHVAGLEHAFTRATEVLPNSPETWYDLARIQVAVKKRDAALSNLKKAVELSNNRLVKEPNAFNVAKDAQTNRNFDPIRTDPEFLKVIGM